MSDIEKIRQEIERRMLELARDKYIDLHDTLCRTKELNLLLAFIDSLPEDNPLNDQRFGEGFDAGRAVQRIFDEKEEKPSEDLKEAARRYSDGPECSWVGKSALEYAFIAGAKWMDKQMPMPEDTVIFMKGVAEGRRLEREEREENKRKEDELPRFYGD